MSFPPFVRYRPTRTDVFPIGLVAALSAFVLRRAPAIALILLLAAAARADVVRILADDREAAQARVDVIRQAKDRIEILYFMAKDDRIALAMLPPLRDA